MKFKTTKHDLQRGLGIVSKAVSTKTTNAILGCILIDCDKEITFTGNNTELGIKTSIEGEIERNGQVAVESALLLSIVSKLPDGDVNIDVDDVMTIKSGKAKFKIPFRSGDDFPTLPENDDAVHFTLDARFFKDIVSQVGFAAADASPSQKVLEGIYLTTNDQILTATAIDGARIAMRKVVIDDSKETEAIVPAKSLKELAKIVNDDVLHVYVSENYFSIEFGNTRAISRLISGKYVDTKPIVGNGHNLKVKIKRKDLLDCIDRAVLLTSTGDKKPVVAEIGKDTLNITINGVMGSMNETIDIISEGEGFRIGFNPRFMIDALNVIEDEDIELFMSHSKAPIIIKDDENYMYLVLPVNIAE